MSSFFDLPIPDKNAQIPRRGARHPRQGAKAPLCPHVAPPLDNLVRYRLRSVKAVQKKPKKDWFQKGTVKASVSVELRSPVIQEDESCCRRSSLWNSPSHTACGSPGSQHPCWRGSGPTSPSLSSADRLHPAAAASHADVNLTTITDTADQAQLTTVNALRSTVAIWVQLSVRVPECQKLQMMA